MIYQFSEAHLTGVVHHRIGEQESEHITILAKSPLRFGEGSPVPNLLMLHLLSAFKEDAIFAFSHPKDVADNPIYQSVKAIFEDPKNLYAESVKIAERMYEFTGEKRGIHGDLFVATFDQISLGAETVRAVGIFKSERKESYLKLVPEDNQDQFALSAEQGISIKKLDKGLLVMDTDQENGYICTFLDKTGKADEAICFMEQFLEVEQRREHYFFTDNYLDVCRGFVEHVYNDENEVPRTEQIDMLNKSIAFFKENTMFNEDRYKDQVMGGNTSVISAFDQYKANYEAETGLALEQEFKVAQSAVKKQSRAFKSVIKLDKNFHVYVHGNRNFIENGYDNNKSMHFYKLYYDKED